MTWIAALVFFFFLSFCVVGYFHGRGNANDEHVKFVRESNRVLQEMMSDFNAHLLEREYYHKQIVAWIRSREKSH